MSDSEAADPTSTLDGYGRAIVVGVVLCGVALRLIAYAHQKSFWIDEAMLVLNLGTRSLGELAEQLDFNQLAPLFFLWGQKLVSLVLGFGEWAQRAPALIAGLLAFPICFAAARRVEAEVARPTSILAPSVVVLIWLALSPTLIYYSNEVKPYGLDFLGAAGLLHLTLGCLAVRPVTRAPRGRLLLVSGVLAPWFAFGSLFVLPVSAALLLWRRRRVGQLLGYGAPVLWGASCLGVVLFTRTVGAPFMASAWGLTGVGPLERLIESGPATIARFLPSVVYGVSLDLLPSWVVSLSWVAGLCLVLGVWELARRGAIDSLVLLLGPFALAIAMHVAGFYPANHRLLLFTIPGMAIVTAFGLVSGLRALQVHRSRVAAAAILAAVAYPLARWGAYEARSPRLGEHSRPIVEHIEEERSPGEPVYVLAGALPAWLVYGMDWIEHAPEMRRVIGLAASRGPLNYRGPETLDTDASLVTETATGPVLWGRTSGARVLLGPWDMELDPRWAGEEAGRLAVALERGARVPSCGWILFSHVFTSEEPALTEELRRRGLREDHHRDGASAKTYRFCTEPEGATQSQDEESGRRG